MLDLMLIHMVFFQVIKVNATSPCFFNYSAGVDMWKNCGATSDYLTFALQPWQWVTGGYFSMVIASILIMFTWIKYQKVVYPIIVGTLFLPISYYLFPAQFLAFAILMAGVAIGILVWYALISQTNES